MVIENYFWIEQGHCIAIQKGGLIVSSNEYTIVLNIFYLF